MKKTVIFHEKATKTRRNKDGDIVCTISPISMEDWVKPTKEIKPYQPFSMKLEDAIGKFQDEMKLVDKRALDAYDSGYDDGYLAGLNQALKLYNEDD